MLMWVAQGGVSASLLGDLASYTSWPDVVGKYLMIPQPSGALFQPTSCSEAIDFTTCIWPWQTLIYGRTADSRHCRCSEQIRPQ